MAIFTPGPAVGQISGRVGGSVFSHNRGGPYIRNGSIPTTVTTDAAVNQKARLASISADWQNLTDAQRLAWVSWAQTNPVVNALGHQITLSGHQAFNQINCRLDLHSQTLLDVPPVGAAPDPLTGLTLTADIGAGDFQVAFTATPLGAAIAIEVWGCIVTSPGITYVDNLMRFIQVSAAAQASPLDIETAFTARFGTPQVGQVVHVKARTVTLAAGLVSGFRQDTAAVTST